MLKQFTAGMATTCCLALVAAAPASARAKPDASQFSYLATIDCGKGSIEIGSGDDVWSPFVELRSGKRYEPVEWHVAAGDMRFDLVSSDVPKGKRTVCSYDDGMATGTVTLVKIR
jgi:hypothetical protein